MSFEYAITGMDYYGFPSPLPKPDQRADWEVHSLHTVLAGYSGNQTVNRMQDGYASVTNSDVGTYRTTLIILWRRWTGSVSEQGAADIPEANDLRQATF